MSKADELYRATCLDILEHGVWDTGQRVRPHWDDGAPAHTVKKFGVVNRYDLREEFPVMTLRHESGGRQNRLPPPCHLQAPGA